MSIAPETVATLKDLEGARGLPFQINKIGHVVLMCSDIRRSTEFYTQVLGFKVSDVYSEDLRPGGMVFMRCSTDHHGIALVGDATGAMESKELDHLAFEVSSLDEVLRARDHLRQHNVQIDFHGRRRAGCQVAVEFRDPDGHRLEIYWGLDQVGSDGTIRPQSEWRQEFTLEGALKNAPPGQDMTLRDPTLAKGPARAAE